LHLRLHGGNPLPGETQAVMVKAFTRTGYLVLPFDGVIEQPQLAPQGFEACLELRFLSRCALRSRQTQQHLAGQDAVAVRDGQVLDTAGPRRPDLQQAVGGH
jgi:hypothetical protein